MNSEQKNTNCERPLPEDVWDVFLPDDEDDPLPEAGDFWFDLLDEDPP